MTDLVKGLQEFIHKSPCNYLAIENLKERLLKENYVQLQEGTKWQLEKGGRYFVTRNDSSLLAFRIPKKENHGFMITASHSDSPCFKVKENPEIDVQGKYTKLSVEGYGGMILSAWLDRPLSLAGRVVVKQKDEIVCKNIDFKKNMLMFVNQAIHMNRKINEGYQYKKNVDMVPLFGDGSSKGTFKTLLADKAGVPEENLISYDMYVYNSMESSVWGPKDCFLSAPRLDDLECTYVGMEAFLSAENEEAVPVFCVYDNEEVGSLTRQGAASTLLKDCLERIVFCTGGNQEDYLALLDTSFMVSADNAHAVHPNFPEMNDEGNRCYMNEGIVIKYQAAQKYATDGVSGAIFRQICDDCNAPYQTYANRSDLAGGSTLGNISGAQVPVRTVDIGLAQLAMHSPYETAGTGDLKSLWNALTSMYSKYLVCTEEGNIRIL